MPDAVDEAAKRIASELLHDLSNLISTEIASDKPIPVHGPGDHADATAMLLESAISRARGVNESLQRKLEAKQKAKELAAKYVLSALDLLLIGLG